MQLFRRSALALLMGAIAVCSAQTASASLITNGTFDTDLSGWTIEAGTTTGVTWVSQTARVGQPGTPGVAIFSQSFDIGAGISQLLVEFDYEWQLNQPTLVDTFTAELVYESLSGTQTVNLVNEGSDVGTFNSVTSFSTMVNLTDLVNVPNNGTIRFRLDELNANAGTRIELDNVNVEGFSAVPEPATIAMWSLMGGVVLLGARRRRRK